MATTALLNLLIVVAAVSAGLWLLAYTVRFVAQDGYGMLRAHRRAPRSHRSELFSARPAL